MTDIGKAYINIMPSMKGLKENTQKSFAGAGRVAKKAMLVGIAGLGVGIVGIMKGAVKEFSELQQNLGGSEAVFGKFAKNVQKLGSEAYKNMGSSQSAYLAGVNKMGSLFQGSGISMQKSVELSTKGMQRAADVASVMGLDTKAAFESIAGAAKGNFTMMDNLGVSMNAATLEAYALEKGLNFKWNTASNAEKSELAMQMFFDKTKKYAGNFAKESEETLSGSFGMMRASWQDLLASFGSGNGIKNTAKGLADSLAAVVKNLNPVIKNILDGIIEAFPTLIDAFIKLIPMITNALIKLVPVVIAAFVMLLSTVIDALIKLIPEVIDALVKALPTIIKSLVSAIPQIIQAAVLAIPKIIDAVIKAIPKIIDVVIKATPQIIGALIKSIPLIIKSLLAAIPRVVTALAKAGGRIASTLFNALRSANWGKIFSGVMNFFKGIPAAIWSGFKKIINSAIMVINKVPGIKIPYLAQGGIVASPTLAVVGERGPEAVIPLSKLGELTAGKVEIDFPQRITLVDSDGDILTRARVIVDDRLVQYKWRMASSRA